jgi:hypothetical protein
MTYNRNNVLKKISELLVTLNNANVSYCHWKSNEHIEASLQGKTDLDILFLNSQKKDVYNLLLTSGFVHFKAAWFLNYSDIEDFIGVDEETGKIIHVHAHFKLIFGERRIKNYHFPIEEEILAARIKVQEYNCYAIKPAQEMILLIIRVSIKISTEMLYEKYKHVSLKILNDANVEFDWLRKRVSIEELVQASEQILGKKNKNLLHEIYNNSLSRKYSKCFYRSNRKKINSYRKRSRYKAFILRRLRLFLYLSAYVLTKLHVKLPYRRRNPQSGLIVAVVGVDGCGKSTLVKNLTSEFSKKIDVVNVYLGSGTGQMSLLRKFPYLFRKMFKAIKSKKSAASNSNLTLKKEPPYLIHSYLSMIACFEKYFRVRKANRAKKKGIVVICDRYPQNQILGINDGPKLHNPPKGYSFLRFLHHIENYLYNKTLITKPDIVIQLEGDVDILMARRQDMAKDLLLLKQESLGQIDYKPISRYMKIDCRQTERKVLALSMKAIWSYFFN